MMMMAREHTSMIWKISGLTQDRSPAARRTSMSRIEKYSRKPGPPMSSMSRSHRLLNAGVAKETSRAVIPAFSQGPAFSQ